MAESQDPNTTTDQGAQGAQGAQTTSQSPAGAPAGGMDVQAEIQKALAAQAAEHAKQLKELTGHDSLKAFQEAQLKAQGKTQELLDAKTQEAAGFKAKYEQQAIDAAILTASGEALDPDTVRALLAGSAQIDGNGAVTINGKPPKEAVAALLKEKPFLAKPAGPAGSGAPQSAGLSGTPNPWAKNTFNLTEQGRIATENPAEAERLRAAAGL